MHIEYYIMNLLQTELVYTNGVAVSTKLMKKLETISNDPDSDRTYINAHFFIVFPEIFLLERIKMGSNREEVLLEIRDSDQYGIMKGIFFILLYEIINFLIYLLYLYFDLDLFEYRARCNGQGDLESRMSLFKLAFRTKLNNWWAKKGPKTKESVN